MEHTLIHIIHGAFDLVILTLIALVGFAIIGIVATVQFIKKTVTQTESYTEQKKRELQEALHHHDNHEH